MIFTDNHSSDLILITVFQRSTISNTSTNTSQSQTHASQNDELFQIAAKAEKLLQEILSAGKKSPPKQEHVKQEPDATQIQHQASHLAPPVITNPSNINQFAQIQNGQYFSNNIVPGGFYPTSHHIAVAPPPILAHTNFGFPPPGNMNEQLDFLAEFISCSPKYWSRAIFCFSQKTPDLSLEQIWE